MATSGRSTQVAHAPADEWQRHPADIARLALSLIVTAALITLSWLAPGAVRTFSTAVVELVRLIPGGVRSFFLGFAQLAAVVGPLAAIGWNLSRRRGRLLLITSLAAALAAGILALLQGWMERRLPSAVAIAQSDDSWIVGAAFPSGAYLAGLTAAVVVLGAASTRQWRHAGTGLVVFAALLRIATAVAVPLDVGVTIAVGASVGSLALVVFGAPVSFLRRAEVLHAVRALGVDADDLVEVDAPMRRNRRFRTTTPPAYVKLIARDERTAELFARVWRTLRVRGVDEDQARWSPIANARNEGLAGLLAGARGVRVPPVIAVGGTDSGEGVVVLGEVEARRLSQVAPAAIDDAFLHDVWRQLRAAQDAGIAHRQLDASNVMVAPDGTAILTDWQRSTVGADDTLLAIDVADLATTLAGMVGADRAIAAATAELDQASLAAAVPLVEALVLSPDNRRAAKVDRDLFPSVRRALADATGTEVTRTEVARLSVARVVGWMGTAVLFYVLLGFASNFDEVRESFVDADWLYFVPLLLLSVMSNVSGAISLCGAVPQRLPLVQTVEVMYAQSFLNRFTPANAGGMALRAKYLEANGSDLPVAAASVGITSAAGGVMQVVVLAVVALWAGQADDVDFDLPDLTALAPILAAILVLAGLVALTPWGRKVIFGTVVPNVTKVWTELRQVASDPTKLSQLFGGALLGKVVILASFVLSSRALGIDTPTSVLCLLYMTANTVAAAAPTPGGVGAIEAALVTVLTSVGIDPGTAISVVMVFRVMTYWLPIIPAYIALTHLRRTGVV